MFQSTKVIDGFSTCFRQWRAIDTHCKFLHGYAISFEITFQGELDEKNWVVDFGGFKRAECLIDKKMPSDWFKHMFDHTTIIAADDPHLSSFEVLNHKGITQLRVLSKVGCEMFAEYVFHKLQDWIEAEYGNRVRVFSVKCMEHEKNSATYIG